VRGIVWIGLTLLASGASQANGAVVKKINAGKRLVLIDEGTKSGFSKKKKVCFFDVEKTKVACGMIRAAKGKSATVLIKKPADLLKITVGMEADIEIMNNKNVKITIDENAPVATEAAYAAPTYIGLFGNVPLRDAVSYQNLVYETPLGQDVDSMWSQDSGVKSIGIGGEVGIGIKSFTLAIGGRQRTFSPKRVSADYDSKDADPAFEEFVETIGKGSSLGYWLDFYYLRWDYGVASLNLGNGIDIDTSTVTFTMDHKSDNNDTVDRYYDAKSVLASTALRTSLLLDFRFGPVGFKVGSVLFIPINQKETLTLTQTDPFTDQFLKENTPDEDLKQKLAHKAQVGFEMLVMGYFAF